MNTTNRGWIAMHRGEVVDTLQEKYPNAFLLLCQIARRARVTPCLINKLEKGESLIGDFKKAGLSSERSYRTAKKQLEEFELATFKATSKGTIAKLINTNVFSISTDKSDEPNDRHVTGKRQTGDERVTTKNNGNKEKNENNDTHSTYNKNAVSGDLVKKIKSLRPEWEKQPNLTNTEYKMLTNSIREEMESLEDKDWDRMKCYLAYKKASDEPWWQPNIRYKFIETFLSVHEQAKRWDTAAPLTKQQMIRQKNMRGLC